MPSIDLSVPRVVSIVGQRGTYTFPCRRILKADWQLFFTNVFHASQRVGKDTVSTFDAQPASLSLFAAVAAGAEGYKVAGDAPLLSLPNWKDLVPVDHRVAVGRTLASAHAVETDDDTIYPEGEPVTIECMWSADDSGHMRLIGGLKHVMRPATEAQHRRFTRESSRTRVLGGSRQGETQYPGAQGVLAALYDELVLSVEGYTVNGVALESVEAIRREMDEHHKVVVAQQIFDARNSALANMASSDEDDEQEPDAK
jgi:hypothetical protein